MLAGSEQCRTRRQRQLVIGKCAAVLHAHGFRRAVNLLHPGREPDIDVVFRVPFLGAEHQPVKAHLAEKVFLESGGRW